MSQTKPTRFFRQASDAAIMLAVMLLALTGLSISGLDAQPAGSTIADLPLADPIIDSDAQFHAQRTSNWQEGPVQFMLLTRDVTVGVGTYGFRADRVVIRIQREAISGGREVRHIWMYLDNAQPLLGRGPTSATAPRLLVTVSTTGKVDLSTDLLENYDRSALDLVADAKARFAKHYAVISQQAQNTQAQQVARAARDQVVADGGPTIVMDPNVDQALQQSPFSADNPTAQMQRRPVPAPTFVPQETVPATTPQTAQAQETAKPQAIKPESKSQVVVEKPVEKSVDQPQMVEVTPTGKPQVQLQQIQTVKTQPVEVTAQEPTPEIAQALASPQGRILPPQGTVSLAFEQMIVDLGKAQPYAVLMGKVGVMYVKPNGELAMSLRADQAVIFLRKKDKDYQQVFSKLDAGDVIGVYLEDNVQVTDGNYTVRSPRAYYDTVANKAVVLDAVMYTWDVKKQVPLYMRAQKVMQLSQTQWQATNAKLTTSEFAEPHFSIAARTITLTQKPDKQGNTAYHYAADDVGVMWGSAKLFGGAHMSGNAEAIPLRNVSLSYSQNNGPDIHTSWDTFMLLGRDRPDGVSSSMAIDYAGQHGPGVGLDLSYDKINMGGLHKGYVLFYDNSDDQIGGRKPIEHDGDVRGFYRGQHRSYLSDSWELSLEMGYVSDVTFLEEMFRSEADSQKPYETSLYLKKQENQSAMTLLANYELNDFTVNTAQLQYQGYTVEKLPELGFYSVGESLFDNKLTYYGQTRASRMRVQAGSDAPSDRGFTNAQSLLLFGQPATQTFSNAYASTNAPTGFVLRLDSRHELQAPMKAGGIDLVPYAVGRATVYDTDFNAYRGNDDNTRLWGSVGIRAHTQVSKTVSDIDNRLFDIHQLRHIVEPSVDVSYSDATVNSANLPVYDYDVEALREGTTISFGLRNTLQTKRGGPGRWRTVDWLVVDSHYVISSDKAEPNPNSLAHYFGYRPEYTRGGDYFNTSVAWMISDSLANMNEFTYDFDQKKVTQWRTGLSLMHTPALTTFVDYEEIDTLDSRLLTYGFTYQITSKYAMAFSHRLDFSSTGDNQRYIDVTLVRELPRWKLIGLYNLNETDGNQTIGIMLVPMGLGGSRYNRPLYETFLR